MERKRLEGGVQEKLSAEDLKKRDSLLGHGASNGGGSQPGRNSPTQSTGHGGRARRPRTKSQVDHVLGTDTIEECLEELDRGLDLTNDEFDFEEIDELIDKFQQDERVKEALNQGVNLREYTAQTEAELYKTERESVEDYIAESKNFLTLLSTISTCDEVLQRMESMLSGFQADLGNISEEIKYLQEQSSSMSVKLRNRKAVETKLSAFIEDIMLPKNLVNNICATEVNEAYIAYLTKLNEKMEYAASADHSQVVAFKEMSPHLESLRVKAVAKIRDFLLQRIYALRKPNTNVQIMQQSTLVKYKYLFHFIATYAPDVALEVSRNYADTMSKIFTAHFKNYIQALAKLAYSTAKRGDLIGVPEEQRKTSGWLGSSAKVDIKQQVNVFSLGDRAQILQQIDSPSIVPHVALQTNQKIIFEELYRSYHHLLLDTITHECAFQSDFFGQAHTATPVAPPSLPPSLVAHSNPARGSSSGVLSREELFDEIFGKSLILFSEHLATHLLNSYDAVGLMLMVRMAHQFTNLMSKNRKLTIIHLEKYFVGSRLQLQERLATILAMNTDSLISAPIPRLNVQTTHPHYITLRFAEFSATRCVIFDGVEAEWWQMGGVAEACAGLRRAMGDLLTRMATLHSSKKNQTVFLINNYDLILKVLHEFNIQSEEVIKFSALCDEQITSFVDQELTHHYGRMIKFVETVKAKLAQTASPREINVDKDMCEKLIEDFGATWKAVFVQLSGEVMNFSNFIKGAEILRRVLMELAVLYKSFSDIVKTYHKDLSKNLVPDPTLTYEIKKYSRSFD